jgi:type I restriction enzyme S subunit
MIADGRYVVFGANGVIGRYNKYNHKEPQLVVTCRGATCGSVNITKPQSWINGNAMVIQPNTSEIYMRYMEYVFRGGIELSKSITGAAQPQITRNSLEPLEFSYPPLEEQQRIIAKLDTAFAEIDKAIKKNRMNISNSKILFEEQRNNIYEKLMKSSVHKKVEEIANLSRGHNPPKSSFINEPRDGYVRYIGEVFRGAKGAFNVALCKLEIKDYELVNEDYLYHMIPSHLIKGELLKNSARSLIPSMSVKELAELTIPLPSFKEQARVAKNIEKLEKQTETLKASYKKNHEKLESLKSAILAQELQPSEAA